MFVRKLHIFQARGCAETRNAVCRLQQHNLVHKVDMFILCAEKYFFPRAGMYRDVQRGLAPAAAQSPTQSGLARFVFVCRMEQKNRFGYRMRRIDVLYCPRKLEIAN